MILLEKYSAESFAKVSAGRIIASYLRSVKVDFVVYPYPWLDPPVVWEGIGLASPKDIAAMKIAAVGQRGNKKDFFDLAELLKIYRLEAMLDFFGKRYPSANKLHYLQSLTYFSEAENDLEPEVMPHAPSWMEVKELLKREVARVAFAAAGG